MLRIHTVMHPMDHAVLNADELERTLGTIINPRQLETFQENNDLDFSYEIPDIGRYRANAHRQRQGIGLSLRAIKTKIPP